ncbi:type VI secretion system tip protein TssI/VgrG [Achromobacter spanius]|uniref:Type VI secretion system tip protein VgrG n=1 Tax=Achromobacter spanius TaxID=217203 RepID=A0AA42S5S9_9BURK|nr:type VI secretion system tip protein TssI/VgrG [Achromobacter spanius]MDH0738385.1 type VI secretion system tip protein VgrG [Achromobacter spanius]
MNALPSNPSTASAYSSMNIATLSQQARMLRVSTPLDAELVAEQMTLREGVSRLFTLTLDCLAASAELDVASLLGKEISVSLLLADGSMRRWHAVVEGVDALGADGGLARYRLHAAPWLAALALRRDSFIYQDRSVQDIVSEIFADYPQAAFAFELSDTLPPLATCTQYRESDLQFVQRILAEAGLSYRFEHQQDDGQAAGGQAAGGGARHRVVIFDAGAARPEDPASPLRFHRSDATETRDSITHFSAAQAVRPNAVARAAWNERTLTAHAAQSRSPVQVEALPVLEDYDYAGHGRYADDDAAEQSAARSLRAHESRIVRFAGAGTARSLAPGRLFAMTQHERYADGGSGGGEGDSKQAVDELGGNRYVVLEVVHEASNNLGAQATQVLNTADMERGTYRNRFTAQPEAAALIPAWRPRPTAPESLAAVVVSASDAPITSDRDLRVKVQFPWQRGDKPLTGGLPHRTHGDASGNAPGDERSGTWLRVASAQAGPNWGAHHLPRGGTEVIVEFIDGDIDRPVVAGQLYNDADLPPWSAGENAETNHAGVLSGWHSQGLDGAGRNQWVFDDTRGKLRTRLASSTAATQLGLGYLVEQELDDANRGAWRGTGFELRSDAWTVLRSGQGMLVSATAREQAKSTQADAQEALLLLRGAQDASRRLNDSAGQHQARPMAAAEGYDELLAALDPEQDGRYTAQVNGQAASKAASGQRTDSAAVERINGPHLLIDAPNSLNLATPASAVLHAGEHLHATAQSDAHVAAQQTYSAVSARSASVFAQQGPIRAISAQAPVSLHAHTDILEALAGQDITVTSSAEGIEILGNQRVTLQAAGGSVTLDGADIVFKGPGLFSVKGATHNFVGPGSDAANLPALPSTTVDDPLIVSAELVHKDGAMASAAKKAASGLMAGFGGAAGAGAAGVGTAGLGDIMPSGLAELGQKAAGAASKLSQLAGQANTLAGMAKNPMGALSAAPGLLGNTSPAMGGLLNTAKNTMGMVSQAQALAANPMSALPTASKLLGSVAPGASGMIDSAASAAGKVSQAAALIKDPSAALPAATEMLASVAPEGASKMISGAATFAGMGSGAASGVGTDAGASAVAGGTASQASAAEATSVASAAPATADAPSAATGGTVQAPQAPAASTATASATSAAPSAADPAASSPTVASAPSVASTSPTATASAASSATGAAPANAATGEHAAGAAAVDTPPAGALGTSPVATAGSASAPSSDVPISSVASVDQPSVATAGAASVAPSVAGAGASAVDPSVAAAGASSVAPSVATAGTSSIAPSIATVGTSSVAPSIATAGASSAAPTILATGAAGSASSLAASAVPTGASFDAPSMGSASDSFVAPTGQTAVSPSSLPSSPAFTASTESAALPDLAASAAPTQTDPAIGGVMAATATPQTIVATDLGMPTVGTSQIATSIPADASINTLPAGSLSGADASTVATTLASASDTTLDVASASTTPNAAGTGLSQWSMQDAAGTPDALASLQDNPTPTMTDATSTLATADHTPIASAATLASASGNGNSNGLLAAAVATAGAATSLRAHADDQGQARSTGASDASGTAATSDVLAASPALANTPGSTHSSASAATSASDSSASSASSPASVSPAGSVDSIASDAPAAVATAAATAVAAATAATAAAFHATANAELTTRAQSEPRPADARIAAGSAALQVTSDTSSAQANGSAARSAHAASPTAAATTPSSSSFTAPGTPVVQDAASVDAHADARAAHSESALPSTAVLASLAASAGALFASAANATSNAASAASSATAAGGAMSGAVDLGNVDAQAPATLQGVNLPDATSGAAASSAAGMAHDETLVQLTGADQGTRLATNTSADISADAASVATPDADTLIASSNTMPTSGISTQTPGFVSNTQSPLPQGAGLPGGSGDGGLNLPGTQASAGASAASGVAGVGAGAAGAGAGAAGAGAGAGAAGAGASSAGLGASGSSAAGSTTATTTAATSAANGSTNSAATATAPSTAQTGADTSAAASAPANAGTASVAGDAKVAGGPGSESASVASAGAGANTPAAAAGASSTNAVSGTAPDASAGTAGSAAHAPANATGDTTGNAAGNASASASSANTSANAPTSASADASANAPATATSPATATASTASTNGASASATPTSPVTSTPVPKAPAATPPASAGTAITAAPATPDANLGSATARAAGMSDSTPATRATDLSAVGGAGASAAATTASGSGASGIAAVAGAGGLATFAQQASAASTALSSASTFAAGGVSANVSAAIVPVMTQALNASGDRMAALSSAVDTLFTLPDVKQANIPSVAGAILSMPGLSSSSVPSVIGAILQSPTLATETLPKVAEVLMKIPGVADSPLPQIARDVLDSVGLGPVARTQGTNLPGGTPPADGSGRVVPGVSTYRARQDGARLQYVNLDQVAERWNDGNALTTTERQSNRPRIHVEFNRPGQHRFTITVKADPANIPYSARERGRRASYQEPHSNPRSYVTNADGTRIVDDIALPAAGLNLYLFEVRDERGQLIKTERVETVRRLYIQEVMCMSARPAHHLADVTPVTAEFALHGIDMIQLPRLQFRGRSAVDAADTPESQHAIMDAVRAVYASSAGKQREPYTLVVCHVDRLAAPGVSGDMRLPVPAGPGGRVMTVPIVNDDRTQSGLWYEFDASDDWLVHARYIHTDASGAERSIPIPRHLITPIRESNGSVWSVSVDLTRVSPTPLTGILNIQFNTVAASYAGLAITGTNLLFVSTLDPYEPNSQAYLTETLAHEMGHLLGMVPSGPDWPGLRTQDDSADDSKLDPPPHFYYNAGGHCYYGLPDQNGEYNEEIGQCVMYGITCANIHFCPSCSKAVRKVDCSEGWTAF